MVTNSFAAPSGPTDIVGALRAAIATYYNPLSTDRTCGLIFRAFDTPALFNGDGEAKNSTAAEAQKLVLGTSSAHFS